MTTFAPDTEFETKLGLLLAICARSEAPVVVWAILPSDSLTVVSKNGS
jgi:hypothetical protein